jgi:hypothetical protein
MNLRGSFSRPSRRAARAAMGVCALLLSGEACAAAGSASASATVMAPVAIGKTADLSFGRFAIGAGGTIAISAGGVRTASGVVPSDDGSAMTAAQFIVSGGANATYSITHGGTTSLARSSGSETMLLTESSGVPSAGTIHVGGTVTVAADQAPGIYTGLVAINVEYN